MGAKKGVIQTCKTILINAFISWRFVKWSTLADPATFDSLYRFRYVLNQVVSFADFVAMAVKELLQYGNSVMPNRGARDAVYGGPAQVDSRRASVATLRRLKGLTVKNMHPASRFSTDWKAYTFPSRFRRTNQNTAGRTAGVHCVVHAEAGVQDTGKLATALYVLLTFISRQ